MTLWGANHTIITVISPPTLWGANHTIITVISPPTLPYDMPLSVVCTVYCLHYRIVNSHITQNLYWLLPCGHYKLVVLLKR